MQGVIKVFILPGIAPFFHSKLLDIKYSKLFASFYNVEKLYLFEEEYAEYQKTLNLSIYKFPLCVFSLNRRYIQYYCMLNRFSL